MVGVAFEFMIGIEKDGMTPKIGVEVCAFFEAESP